ncbi:MAG: hypothetical protein UX31_C0017G0032 [Candidatus Nomurabacteria bacterium GW2011_GWA1_46_11]|uniref:LTD domain-containing protein n=2 Tax=Parcubacteria group TaxID=1794811 RepID=A0A1G1YWN2_9BACT|nr:MAG: hypothetical protein UX29_C0016G0009 [Parcubacteria group bacterium GW2011_GWA2_46_10]KKU21448.1 MAG: hypothetical protein UX31_C0017G0032 [Candidatus Nomurabacteria bacterium GW2011_GWA1_46_11]OGY56791.1 MAG: hypothetical protein A2119_01930 [Candidatus Colwellbacteria bacterium GWA2_46_10]
MIFIKELLPNPSGDDTQNEWIRLINTGESDFIPSGLSLIDAGGKTFSLNSISAISPGETIELKRTLTGIALNNDGDIVSLKNQQGETLDQLSYASGVVEGEIVTAESFIEEPPSRDSLGASALGFGRIDYQPTLMPILVGILIAIVSGAIVWFMVKRDNL